MAKVEIILMDHAKDLGVPAYATAGSSGFDLMAAIDESVTLLPLERKLIKTGIKTSFSSKYEIQVRPRSGNALKLGFTVLNTPGTIDSDYAGEIGVILINLSDKPVVISRGLKIAQAVLCPVMKAIFIQVDSLDETERGAGGFGSTDQK